MPVKFFSKKQVFKAFLWCNRKHDKFHSIKCTLQTGRNFNNSSDEIVSPDELRYSL